ncbi:MAG: hypothetical protein A2W22_00685 [Candidatus Levybacteria bacterium RBG_16_35_11]|nr:MAG: hypothetical protein A2W22_00685 [Candidatus Levybacteria bacterium RBG_16_35_11]
MCFTFKRYAPITTIIIPTSFNVVGNSLKVSAANIVVKIGPKEAIGEITESGEIFIAVVESIKAATSINAAMIIVKKNKEFNFGSPVVNIIIKNEKGITNKIEQNKVIFLSRTIRSFLIISEAIDVQRAKNNAK